MLSAIIITSPNEKDLKRSVSSVQFADEVLLVVDGDEKSSIKIQKESVTSTYFKHLHNDFAAQRNFGLEKAKGEWILFIDSDEEVTPQLAVEIRKVVNQKEQSDTSAYHIKRRDFFWGSELRYGEVRRAYTRGIIRLVRSGSGKWIGSVHETYITEKKTARLKSFINHYPHPTIAAFLKSVNFYSTLRAQLLYGQGKKSSVYSIMFQPPMKFVYTYFIRAGFRDGPPGFVYSFLMSFHSFLVQSKLYLLWKK